MIASSDLLEVTFCDYSPLLLGEQRENPKVFVAGNTGGCGEEEMSPALKS